MLGFRIETNRQAPAESWGSMATARPGEVQWVGDTPVIAHRRGRPPLRAQAALEAIAAGAETSRQVADAIGAKPTAARTLLESMLERGLVLRVGATEQKTYLYQIA